MGDDKRWYRESRMTEDPNVVVRDLNVIAADIRSCWPRVSPHAEPYLTAMASLKKMTDMYHADTAESVVIYFLANTGTWRGPAAKTLKDELKRLLKTV